jgi:hypothetical protein
VPTFVRALLVFASFVLCSAVSFAQFNPTTTLSAETGNNTSAADSFTAQSNGNLGAVNVSKVPTRTLLYSGASAKIYAHFMPWFGGPDILPTTPQERGIRASMILSRHGRRAE